MILPALLISLFLHVPSVAVDAEALVHDAARAYLESSYPEVAARLDVRVDRVVTDALAGPIRIEPLSPEIPRALSKVNVFEQGTAGWQRAGWALIYVAHYDSVAIPTRDVERGAELTEKDFAAAWIETTRFHGDPLRTRALQSMLASTGAVAQRPLKAGRPLKQSDVRAPYAVQTGDAIRVRYVRNGFQLELQGQAREAGSVGDEIRVYSSDTRTNYRVRITAPGHADWMQTL